MTQSSTEAERREKEAFHRHLAGEIVAELPYRPEDQRAVLAAVLQMLNIPAAAFHHPRQPVTATDEAMDNVVLLRQLHATRRPLRLPESFSAESNFRRTADKAPTLIWRSGPDKLMASWFNRAWLDFTGRTLEQERGTGWAQGLHKADFDRCLRTYVSAYDRRAGFTLEYRLRRHDGVYRWILDNGRPCFSQSGRFRGYFGSGIDIHERKQAEAAALSEGASLVAYDGAEVDYAGLVPERLDGPLLKVIDDGDDLHFIYRDRHLVRSKADFALTRLRLSTALGQNEVGDWPDLRGFKREGAI